MYALFLLLLGAVILTLKVAFERLADIFRGRIFSSHNYNLAREFELETMYQY